MSIKISIVDDHPLLIKGLQSLLQHSPEVEIIGTYMSAKDLLSGLQKNIPDVLLLDIQMPNQSGEELAPLLRRQYPEMMLLVLTHMEQEYYIKTLLQHGVTGYVLKGSNESILLEAIQTVAKGHSYYDPSIRKQAMKALNPDIHPVITRREIEVLELIAQNYTSNEIAQKLFLSKRTIDRHRENMILKMGVKNVTTLLKKAIELGLIKY